jgi:hypothetical protein
MRLLKELYTGKRDSFSCPFRCMHGNGLIEERETSGWVAKSEWCQEADGRRWQKPLQVMFQTSPDLGIVIGNYGSPS